MFQNISRQCALSTVVGAKIAILYWLVNETEMVPFCLVLENQMKNYSCHNLIYIGVYTIALA